MANKKEYMKKLLKTFFIVIFGINLIPNICFSQDTQPPTEGTPTIAIVDNLFASRTVEQEEPLETPNTEHSSTERLYTIQIGQPSPATGTVFNTSAVAWLDVHDRYIPQFYMIQLNFRLNQTRAAARLRIESLQLQLDTQRQISELRIGDLNSQLELERQISTELRTGSIPVSERRHFRKRTIYIAISTALIVTILSTCITYSIK